MCPKDVDKIANSVDPDQRSSLIWVCTVCPLLSVRKLRNSTVYSLRGVSISIITAFLTKVCSCPCVELSFCWFNLPCNISVVANTTYAYRLCFYVLHLMWCVLWWACLCKLNWASSCDNGTYHVCEQRRLRRACASAQSRQSLHCSHTWSMEVDEGSDQKSGIQPHLMAAHARLKNEFMEDEKYHNVMRRLISASHFRLP